LAQTLPTHALAGIALAVASTDNLLMGAALTAGAVAPDSVTFFTLFLKKSPDGKSFANGIPKWLRLGIEASHNLFVWTTLILMSWTFSDWFDGWLGLLVAFSIGGLLHVIIDVFTHGGKEFFKTDCKYAWPIADLRSLGFCEYRRRHGEVWPIHFRCLKPWEMTINIALLIFIVASIV
jgi:membrane-bound metal-dependent hydrolase YbcI (DUF457 family)